MLYFLLTSYSQNRESKNDTGDCDRTKQEKPD